MRNERADLSTSASDDPRRESHGTAQRSARRFSLLDVMVLVALSAGALAVHRHFQDSIHREWNWRIGGYTIDSTWFRRRDWIAYGLTIVYPLPLLAAPTLVALQAIRSPRSRRRLMSLSGMTACTAVCVMLLDRLFGIALQCVWLYVRDHEGEFWFYLDGTLRLDPEFPLFFWLQEWLADPPCFEGAAVAGVWGVLALGGRLRTEPTWIDRAGRAVGVYFLICFVFWSVLEL